MKKGITLTLVILGISAALNACSAQDVQNAAKQLEEINNAIDDFKDPESVVEYLREQTEPVEEEVIEEEPIVYVTYNVSAIGYTPDGDQFGIKVDTEPEVPEYTLVTCEEAKEAGATIITKPNLYGNASVDYMDSLLDSYESYSDIDEEALRNLIMNESDALIYLEYYPEGGHVEKVSELSRNLAAVVYKSIENKDIKDTRLMYNISAVLAKAVYVLDTEDKDMLKDMAIQMWENAEEDSSDDSSLNGNRAWAAAELYRMTGQKTYRTIVEAIEQEENLHGVSFENPGYYAVFAYLSAENNTDYNVSGKMMDYFFHDINGKIKEDKSGLLESSLDPDNMLDGVPSSDFINRIIDDSKLSLMANYISISVEYTKFAKTRVTYLTGANVTGINYIDVDHMKDYDPMLFVLCGLSEQ